ncbi:AMP-binding protein [Paenibacillus sp. CAU 1782]
MGMVKLLIVLRQTGLLSPPGLTRVITAVTRYGSNLMALLSISAKTHSDHPALGDENETLSYRELLGQSEVLSHELISRFGITRGSKVGFLCKNHGALVKSLFAVSRAGADIFLLNAEMGQEQMEQTIREGSFDLLIHDPLWEKLLDHIDCKLALLPTYAKLAEGEASPCVDQLCRGFASPDLHKGKRHVIKRASGGRLMLLTGGTTGKAKTAPHKPSLFSYLNPMSTLLDKLRLMEYGTGYIATPIYHGYGIAMLLLFVALGKKIVITPGFNASHACDLIKQQRIEFISVVPLMLKKMLAQNPDSMRSLRCIASGGAELPVTLAEQTRRELGKVLFNLYGTSEAGLATVATPDDLRRYPGTIGQRISGVPLVVRHASGEFAGEDGLWPDRPGVLALRKSGAAFRGIRGFIGTGDLGYRNREGYFFLCGREDDMIVSGGENVYPVELERVLLRHPLIADAVARGVTDDDFGQRLVACVQLQPGAVLSEAEIADWLRGKAARYQMPRDIRLVDELPYTPLGKVDRKRVAERDGT